MPMLSENWVSRSGRKRRSALGCLMICAVTLGTHVLLPRSVPAAALECAQSWRYGYICFVHVGFKPARIISLEHVLCVGYAGSAEMETHSTVLTTGQHRSQVRSWQQPCRKLALLSGHSREGRRASSAAQRTRFLQLHQV